MFRRRFASAARTPHTLRVCSIAFIQIHDNVRLGTYHQLSHPVQSFLVCYSRRNPLQTLPHDLTEGEREAIVAYFNTIPTSAQEERHLFEFHLAGRPRFFIKQGDDVLSEAYTQYFFYRLSRNDPSAPLIPRVWDAFVSPDYYHYFLVMEKIDAPTLSASNITDEEAVEYAASAVKWLLEQTPLVPATVFGRISLEKAPVWHRFFKDHQAPGVFENADRLLEYVNMV